MKRANPGRVAALRALVGVEEGGHAEDLLGGLAPAGGPDRALAWHLTLGTLRWRGSLDHGLNPHLRRGIDSLDAPVRWAMRMGLFEAARCRTPARAAVHQAVECTKAVGMKRASGMVNAVLRKASQIPLSEDPSVTLPPWLAQRWSSHSAWIQRLREPALISVAGSCPKGLETQTPVVNGIPVPNMWTLPSGMGQVSQLEGFDEGAFWVMDPAAAAVADIVIEAIDHGASVLDACAAPGGKAFRMHAAGLDVSVADNSPSRIERLQANMIRLGMTLPVLQHDWLTGPAPTAGLFDAVLVDAPCSALGVVRRHPEILWRRHPGDPAAMSISQRIILKHAAAHVKPGGVLIYAVCSTEPEEGPAVANALEGWTVTKTWSTVPPAGDEDGFQAFVLKKVED